MYSMYEGGVQGGGMREEFWGGSGGPGDGAGSPGGDSETMRNH